jgi:hypothetical protein
MAEVELAEHTYRVGRLNAIQQWEIFRRLGPVLPMLSAEMDGSVAATPGARWIMSAVAGFLSQLKQEDADYILHAALAVVERFDPQNQRWFRVASMNGTGGLMYQDIELLTMLELMDRALQENMGSFFAQLRAASDASTSTRTETDAAGLPALPVDLH